MFPWINAVCRFVMDIHLQGCNAPRCKLFTASHSRLGTGPGRPTSCDCTGVLLGSVHATVDHLTVTLSQIQPFLKIEFGTRISQACGRVLMRGFFDNTRSNRPGVVGGVSGSALTTPIRQACTKNRKKVPSPPRQAFCGAEFRAHVDCNLV